MCARQNQTRQDAFADLAQLDTRGNNCMLFFERRSTQLNDLGPPISGVSSPCAMPCHPPLEIVSPDQIQLTEGEN